MIVEKIIAYTWHDEGGVFGADFSIRSATIELKRRIPDNALTVGDFSVSVIENGAYINYTVSTVVTLEEVVNVHTRNQKPRRRRTGN